MGNLISPLVFQPPSPTYSTSSRYMIVGKVGNNQIPAFYISYPEATFTLLFSHGNAEDLGMIYMWFETLTRKVKINVFAYDYPGYGISGGEPSEKSCYESIEIAYGYLTKVLNAPPSNIILYGRSLGSGPTCYLARKLSKENRHVAGVILQSPLLSIFRVAFQFRFSMPGDMFCNIDHISHIESPITIIHGTKDEVVPFSHGEELFAACSTKWRSQPLWIDGAGHNNIELLLGPGDRFFDHFREFQDICKKVVSYRSK